MKTLESSDAGRSFGGLVVAVLLLVVVMGGAIYYFYSRSPSLQNAFRSVKGSSQDAATTSKVRTALLLSKHVAAFDIKVETSQGEVTLTGQVPSEEIKAVAGAIAQDTSGAKQVHNELTVNPAAERNPETERLRARIADLEIETIISDALLNSTELSDKRIEAQVNKGVVTLNGTVETPFTLDETSSEGSRTGATLARLSSQSQGSHCGDGFLRGPDDHLRRTLWLFRDQP